VLVTGSEPPPASAIGLAVPFLPVPGASPSDARDRYRLGAAPIADDDRAWFLCLHNTLQTNPPR